MTNTRSASRPFAALNSVYKIEVFRALDGLQLDTFFTGYPERDIATERSNYLPGAVYFMRSVAA